MHINWKPGLVWLEHTGENVAVTFCGALMGVMLEAKTDHLSGVDWAHALDVAGYAALLVALVAISSRKISNGTASLNPRVIARKHIGRKTTNVAKPAPVPKAPTTADLKQRK